MKGYKELIGNRNNP